MKPIEEIRSELVAHGMQHPDDAVDLLDEFVAERARAVESITLVAETEGRRLLASEERTVAKYADDLEGLRRLRDTLVAKGRAARDAQVAELRDNLELAARRSTGIRTGTSSPARDTALRHAESRTVRIPDAARESIVRCVDAAHARGAEGSAVIETIAYTADPDYATAFAKLIRHGESAAPLMWTAGERDAFHRVSEFHQRTALQSGTTTGSYLTPAALDPAIILTGTGSANPLRQVATVKTVAAPIWRGVSAAQVTASYDSELSEVSDDTPVLAQPEATLFRGSCFLQASMEWLADVQGDWLSEMAAIITDARDNLEASSIAYNGNGTTAPNGFWVSIQNVTNSRVNSTTAATFGLPDAFAVQNALPARYSGGARWFASLSIINKIRQAAMAQTGAGVWQDLAGSPAQFLGRPVHELSTAPTSTTTGDYPLLYADPSRFTIVDHVGSTIEMIPHLFSTSNGRPIGARGFFAVWRSGAVQTDTNSGRILKIV